MTDSIKILLADDHILFMNALEMMIDLEPQYQIVGKVKDGEEVITFLNDKEVDVIILDINMPKLDGIDTLKEMQNTPFTGAVIMLSSISDSRMIHDCMKNGALGYLTKKCARKEIIDAIRAVNLGKSYFGQEVNRRILNDIMPSNFQDGEPSVEEPYSLKQLTERELEVLRLIAMEYTSREIAAELFIAQSTVDTHRKKLIEKLKVKNAVGLGKIALKNGLI